MPGKRGVDQGQSPDAPKKHQQNENALRHRPELRRQSQRQSHRARGGGSLIEASAQRQALDLADDRRANKRRGQVQQ